MAGFPGSKRLAATARQGVADSLAAEKALAQLGSVPRHLVFQAALTSAR
jgi:hypothetical protein